MTSNDLNDQVMNLDEEDQDREDLMATIADYLAALSEPTPMPQAVDPPSYAFDPSDVDFSDPSNWTDKFAEVQGWLNLSEFLEQTNYVSFVNQISRVLGLQDQAVHDQSKAPGIELLEALRSRAERAVQLKEKFIEEVESNESDLGVATVLWNESWEEESDETKGGPVTATAGIWPISDFVSRSQQDKLELSPSFQRSDVWPTGDAQLLIESILRGIPLPSVIILKPKDGKSSFQVVDGKQRLTAIFRFIGKHPEALRKVSEIDSRNPKADLLKNFESNYPKFRRIWKQLTGETLTASLEREYYFPFKLRTGKPGLSGELKPLEGKYYCQIQTEQITVANEQVAVQDVFQQTIEYKIPIIQYHNATQAQIHEVFNLYNKQGKHLNAEEIRNAVYHETDLARAFLVASGDSKNILEVAPFLSDKWDQLEEIQHSFDGYKFGSARFRRTKVLSSIAAVLLLDTIDPETSKLRNLSTARQIDALFDQATQVNSRLRNTDTIVDLLLVIQRAVDAHSAIERAWAPKFQHNKSQGRWQELQLIASIVGVAAAAIILGDEVKDRLHAASDNLQKLTSTEPLLRPQKTQTIEQCKYIAMVVNELTRELGVNLDEVDREIKSHFGSSGIQGLQARLKPDTPSE